MISIYRTEIRETFFFFPLPGGSGLFLSEVFTAFPSPPILSPSDHPSTHAEEGLGDITITQFPVREFQAGEPLHPQRHLPRSLHGWEAMHVGMGWFRTRWYGWEAIPRPHKTHVLQQGGHPESDPRQKSHDMNSLATVGHRGAGLRRLKAGGWRIYP